MLNPILRTAFPLFAGALLALPACSSSNDASLSKVAADDVESEPASAPNAMVEDDDATAGDDAPSEPTQTAAEPGDANNGGGGNTSVPPSEAPAETAGGGTDSGPVTPECILEWPEASGDESLGGTVQVPTYFDGEMRRFSGSGVLGTGSQDEDQGPLFVLSDGATMENVILGSPAADGIHCEGSCTLRNVWWEDVGEDAATLRGDREDQVMTVECSGARGAEDKVFQHNGPGTFEIRNVLVEDFNRLYRSCGNCESQFTRHVVLEDVTVTRGRSLVGLNENYDDTADFARVTILGSEEDVTVCARYIGNDTGEEPISTGSGPDSEHCRYEDSDITWR